MKVKPKVVEIFGLPNAGKTELVRYLERYFNEGYKIRFIQDPIREAPVEGQLDKNIWTVGRLKTLFLEAKQQDRDLIIIERGAGAVFASLGSFLKQKQHLNQKGDRQRAETNIIEALNMIKQEEDFFIFVDVSIETALERDRRAGRNMPGTIISPEFLDILQESYQCLCKEHLPISKVKLVNGNLDKDKDADLMQKCRAIIVRKLISLIPH
ncbi:hypothetical protein KKH07_02545 [Patescibacteria group bacterium]|nr:hypothetical protein [Patescibacteria group bacterium]MBU1563504.1 hypothetical protein [Patescibacteria group bacterium]MBU2068064.1 hypothetical protein [Patescibacteria group bacterium]